MPEHIKKGGLKFLKANSYDLDPFCGEQSGTFQGYAKTFAYKDYEFACNGKMIVATKCEPHGVEPATDEQLYLIKIIAKQDYDLCIKDIKPLGFYPSGQGKIRFGYYLEDEQYELIHRLNMKQDLLLCNLGGKEARLFIQFKVGKLACGICETKRIDTRARAGREDYSKSIRPLRHEVTE